MNKISIRQIKKISKRDEVDSLVRKIRNAKYTQKDKDKLIKLIKEKIKKDPTIIEKFKEYKVPLKAIDEVEMSFVPLDVSAKTKNKKIYLNENMLYSDSKVSDPVVYAIHECIHLAQQISGEMKGHDKKDYLSKDTEIESFKAQVDYTKRNEGEEKAEDYVSDLLSYHNKDGEERKKLKKKLLGE